MLGQRAVGKVSFGAPECQVPRPGCRLFLLQRVLFAPAERHDSHRRVLADTRAAAERCGLANEPPSAPLSMTDGASPISSHSREVVVTPFEPHARALTVRIFGANTAVLFGRCAAVVVCLSPAVMLLQLLSHRLIMKE